MRTSSLALLAISGVVAAKLIGGARTKVASFRRSGLGGWGAQDNFGGDAWAGDLFASITADPAGDAMYGSEGLSCPGDGVGQMPQGNNRTDVGGGDSPAGSYHADPFARDEFAQDPWMRDLMAVLTDDPSGLGLAPQRHHNSLPGQIERGSWSKDRYAADPLTYDDNAVDPFAGDPEDPAGLGRSFRNRVKRSLVAPAKLVRRDLKRSFAPLSQTLRKVASAPVKLIRSDVRRFGAGAKAALRAPFSQLKQFQKNDPFSAMMKSRDLFSRRGKGNAGGGGQDGGALTEYRDADGKVISEAQYNSLNQQAQMQSNGVTVDSNGIVSANNQGYAPPGGADVSADDAPSDGPSDDMFISPLASESSPDAFSPDSVIPETEAQFSSDSVPVDMYARDPLNAVRDDFTVANGDLLRSADAATSDNFAIQPDQTEAQPAPIDLSVDAGVPTGGRIRVNDLDWMAVRADQPSADLVTADWNDDAAPLSGLGELCDVDGRVIALGRPRGGAADARRWRTAQVTQAGVDVKRLQADAAGNVWTWQGGRLVTAGNLRSYGGANRVRRLITPPNTRQRGGRYAPRLVSDGADQVNGVAGMDGFSFKSLTWGSSFHDKLTKTAAYVDPSFAAYKRMKRKQPVWSRYRRIWGYSAPYVAIAGAAVATYYTGGATSPALAAAIASASASAGKQAYGQEMANRRRTAAMDAQRDEDMRTGSAAAAEAAAVQDAGQPRDTPAPLSWLQPEAGSAPGELPGGDSANQYQGDGILDSFLDVADIN